MLPMNATIYKDKDKNAIRFSQIKKIEAEMPFNGLGIKYVAAGEEVYYANNKKYVVMEGEYIIGNDFTSSIVQINHQEPVQGLCIDISPQIIAEVANYHQLNTSNLQEFLLSDQFFVNKYHVKNTSLGYSLRQINSKIRTGEFNNDLNKNELFYSLAESIIGEQRFILDQLSKLDFKKTVTREETLRAILGARTYMEEHADANLSLEQICAASGLSKYHFIRVFKATFGISPYQYQISCRLQKARIALMNGKAIFDTAILFGYADVATFSKAFKQMFGCSPGAIKK
jgi:AraC-like DNA-binding protein